MLRPDQNKEDCATSEASPAVATFRSLRRRKLVLKNVSKRTKAALVRQSEEIRRLELMDYLFFSYIAVIFIVLTLFGQNNPAALRQCVIHAVFLALGVFILSVHARRSNRLVFFWRVWYIPAFYIPLFEQVGHMIPFVRPAMLDPWVFTVETKLFGGFPTIWLQNIANPWLTELMSLFYLTYYFLIPLLGLTLYRRKQWRQLNDFLLANTVTFFFCFLHYLLVPVAGPIFFTQALPFELAQLQGGPVTVFEQWLFFKGAIQGGAFPSSHVAVAVVVLYFAMRYRTYRYVLLVTVIGLSISTVYNGYHYGIDVIYGVVVGLVFSYLCPLLNNVWKNRPDFHGVG